MTSLISNPFKSHDAQQAQSHDNEQSLSTILSEEQRKQLTLLLNSIMASQRKTITDIFDPRYAGKPTDAHFDNPLENRDLDLSNVDVSQLDREKRETERRIKELSEPEMQSLKKAALAFFDAWRESVLARVGEVVSSKNEARQQKEEAEAVSPTPNSKRLSRESARKVDESVADVITRLYPPIRTPLTGLDEEKRKLVLHSVMLLLLSLERYAAHSRILLLYLTTSLQLSLDFLTEDESKTAKVLLQAAEEMSAEEERKKKEDEGATSRKWKVGLATVAGAAIVGITGGLAAPLVAAGIGSVMGGIGLGATAAAGYLGTLASSSLVVGGLFGAYGGRMTGRMMDEYAREVEDFGFVPVRKWAKPRKIDKDYRRLRVAIGISGWLTDKEEVIKPWRVIGSSIEAFALKWELEALLNLGNAMSSLLKTTAWGYAKKEIIARTIFASLSEALWPLALLKVSKVVDNPFSVAKARADKAGLVLADALINKAQGERPVTLIGYSLGARVIHRCLLSLASRNAFGLVENAVLLGTPATADSADWRRMRAVVSGRLVNAYSRNDYVLAFLYRTSSLAYGVAGLQPAEFVRGVENVDVSDLVDGHLRYRFLAGSILKHVGLEDIELAEIEQEEAEMRAMDELEGRNHQAGKENEPAAAEGDDEAAALEREVQRKNERSMLDWAHSKFAAGRDSARALWTKPPESVGTQATAKGGSSNEREEMEAAAAA